MNFGKNCVTNMWVIHGQRKIKPTILHLFGSTKLLYSPHFSYFSWISILPSSRSEVEEFKRKNQDPGAREYTVWNVQVLKWYRKGFTNSLSKSILYTLSLSSLPLYIVLECRVHFNCKQNNSLPFQEYYKIVFCL